MAELVEHRHPDLVLEFDRIREVLLEGTPTERDLVRNHRPIGGPLRAGHSLEEPVEVVVGAQAGLAALRRRELVLHHDDDLVEGAGERPGDRIEGSFHEVQELGFAQGVSGWTPPPRAPPGWVGHGPYATARDFGPDGTPPGCRDGVRGVRWGGRSELMPPDQPDTTDRHDLEKDMRQFVDEIEAGEDGEPAAATESAAARPAGPRANVDGGIEQAVRQILLEIGEDPEREGLLRTPERMHKMWLELTCGYRVDPDRLINGAVFDVGYSEMVVIKGIPFYSLCEHHMLPFFGIASVGYLPRGRVIGLSKIPRIVEMYARRLQVQERMTQQIADFLQQRLNPYGVGVVIEAEHLCLAMRGVQKGGATMVTSSVLGTFRTTKETRDEFMAHLERAVPRV